MNFQKLILTAAALVATVFVSTSSKPQKGPVYLDPNADVEARVQDALSRMTREEKVAIIHAQSKFSSPGVKRLGIDELWTDDGPHGVRPELLWAEWKQAKWSNDSCVAFPALTCLAATWNRDMASIYGNALAEEALYRGKDVMLGPGVNIYRSPLAGRNFEYMGEDPFLAGEIAAKYIRGVQKNGVATCVKHFCLNNEETHRHTVDIDLDDRALYEIYLPAFKKAVYEGESWSIMASYNLYRGQHVSHNKRILCDILKGEWEYDGAVISDWGACHNTDEAIHNGLDLEFGTVVDKKAIVKGTEFDNYYLALPYLEKMDKGEVDETELNDKAARVLRLIFRTAMRDGKSHGSMCSEEHYAVARKIADEGIVLLKNEKSLLPVGAKVKNILVVGENATKMLTVGGGSSALKAQREIMPLDGITARAAKNGAKVEYEKGYSTKNGANLEGLAAKAAKADVVIFVGGLNKDKNQDCEGKDRTQYNLPYGQDEVIAALAKANKNLCVVLLSGNAVAMPWLADVPAILQGWYLGSESGEALADVLFGDVNPSGKLPFTFPVALEDGPAHQPGLIFPNDGPTKYPEGIFVGYRWYEHKNIKPQFPFGFGLSYTTFEYGKATISGTAIKSVQGEVAANRTAEKAAKHSKTLVVKVPVTNTGKTAGSEIVQFYISDVESYLPRPAKELRDFAKVELQPGETKVVTFKVDEDMLRFFDADKHAWVSEKGEFKALVGASSADIKSTLTFTLK